MKKENNATENQLPSKKKFRIPYQNIIVGVAAFAYFFTLQTSQVLATDMWSKADTILKDVYGKILGISTIAAIVTASVALLLMNFSKSGRTVDESRAWLKRIAISWVILNGLGFILAYVTPFHRACSNIGGEFIQISPASRNCINIMEIRKVDSSANDILDGPQTEKSELAAKIQRLHIFFSLLIPDMTHEERQLLDEALIQTYNQKGITHNNESLPDPDCPERYREMPVLEDVFNILKTHYKDRLRGLRLTCDGKRMLLSENPERFSFYLNGSSDTNHPRSDYPRRLRLQQSSIVYAMLLNSGVRLFRDQKPLLFQEEYQCRHGEPIHMELPVFYHSREVKELGTETVKIGNSRIMGILFARDCIYALFYTGDAPMKWEYRTELRVKTFLSYHASCGFLSKGHASPCYQPDTPVKAVLIGSGMDTPLKLMESTGGFQKSCFYLDNSFDYFHYIPDDAAGETMLRLLCSPALQKALRDLLLSDLQAPCPDYGLEHDAVSDGLPVLLAFDFDMLRLSRFHTALNQPVAQKRGNDMTGLLILFAAVFTEIGYYHLYHLDRYRDEIIALEGFGEKSYENLIASINESRSTTFVRFVVAMDIPLIGRTASRILDRHFHGSLRELRLAALDRFDFTCLEGIGDTMSSNLHKWFRNPDHLLLWGSLQKELHFENGLDAQASGEENNMDKTTNNTFAGCTIVATGKLENFTRDGINAKIISLGATPGSSVTKKTDYLICGEKAGSKLAKAQQLGVKILTEQQFLEMLSA